MASTTITSSEPTVLWTPRVIAATTFFLGIPGGAVLAAINWSRLGLRRLGINHLIVGTLITSLIIFLPVDPSLSRALNILFGSIAMQYLRVEMKKDIVAYQSKGYTVKNANWFVGVLIGISALIAYLICITSIKMIASFFSIQV